MATGSKIPLHFSYHNPAQKPPIWDELRIWLGVQSLGWALYRGKQAERISFRWTEPETPVWSERDRLAQLDNEPFWSERCVRALWLNAQATPALFPAHIAPPEALQALFGLSHPLNPTDRVHTLPWPHATELQLVWANGSAIEERASNLQARETLWLHPMALMTSLEVPKDPELSDHLWVYVQTGCVDVVLFAGGRPVLLNRFEARTPEEALYYALQAGQTSEWNPGTHGLTLSGPLSRENEWRKAFQAFVRQCRWAQDPTEKEHYARLFHLANPV
ncbi:DUF3822 family protein [bacterium]|nr:DUF3822 family protein [bacterium]